MTLTVRGEVTAALSNCTVLGAAMYVEIVIIVVFQSILLKTKITQQTPSLYLKH